MSTGRADLTDEPTKEEDEPSRNKASHNKGGDELLNKATKTKATKVMRGKDQETKQPREDSNVPERSSTQKRDKSKMSANRDMRRRRREEMRSKSLGVVGKIDTRSNRNRKTNFDDNFTAQANDGQKAVTSQNKEQENENEYDKDIEDDDDGGGEIEEVKGSQAREDAIERRKGERNSSLEMLNFKKKRRKRAQKAVEKDEEGEEDDLDEKFFMQLDSELETKRQERKQKFIEPKGKRTTFVSDDSTKTFEAEHNISVVVLKSPSLTIPQSSRATSAFSRNKIQSGKDIVRKSKKRGMVDEGWSRSNKVSRLMITPRGAKRQARPAPRFVANP